MFSEAFFWFWRFWNWIFVVFAEFLEICWRCKLGAVGSVSNRHFGKWEKLGVIAIPNSNSVENGNGIFVMLKTKQFLVNFWAWLFCKCHIAIETPILLGIFRLWRYLLYVFPNLIANKQSISSTTFNRFSILRFLLFFDDFLAYRGRLLFGYIIFCSASWNYQFSLSFYFFKSLNFLTSQPL